MKNGTGTWPLNWRRFAVDTLIGASTIAVAFAAVIGSLTDVTYTLLIAVASALVGLGLLIEPSSTAQPAPDIG